MKKRTGFVSNSSSSSYIIAVKDPNEAICEHCGRGPVDIISSIEDSYDDETSVRHYGLEEIQDLLKDNLRDAVAGWLEFDSPKGWEDDLYWREVLDLAHICEENGYQIVYISIGYDQEALNSLIHEMAKSANLIILYDMA